ncbi:MAG: RHS repeat-associated core domain-containing protein [bacterium]|nr:RHS repeat-associated core domain-containing protein [bacterium]
MRDLSLNELPEAFKQTFTWPEEGAARVILVDEAAPAVDEVVLRDGHLEVTLSEEPDMALVGAAFLVDGGIISWTLEDDTYTVRSEVPLPTGEHTLRIDGGAPFDLAGKGLEEPFEPAVSVEEGIDNTEIYSRPDPRLVDLESLVNRFTFHGRPFDLETGFYYFRNRYFDPELGRLITADPLGYADGPSMYQFAGYSPFTNADPLGLHEGPRVDRSAESAMEIGRHLAGSRLTPEERAALTAELKRTLKSFGMGVLKFFPTFFATLGGLASGKNPAVHDFRAFGALEPANREELGGMVVTGLSIGLIPGRFAKSNPPVVETELITTGGQTPIPNTAPRALIGPAGDPGGSNIIGGQIVPRGGPRALIGPVGDPGGRSVIGGQLFPRAGTNPTRFLTNSAGTVLDLRAFQGLRRNPGTVATGRSGAGRSLTGPANSYTLTEGGHALVYGPEGRLLYDISASRIKVFQWNRAPSGQWFPRTGSELKFTEVPQAVLDGVGL